MPPDVAGVPTRRVGRGVRDALFPALLDAGGPPRALPFGSASNALSLARRDRLTGGACGDRSGGRERRGRRSGQPTEWCLHHLQRSGFGLLLQRALGFLTGHGTATSSCPPALLAPAERGCRRTAARRRVRSGVAPGAWEEGVVGRTSCMVRTVRGCRRHRRPGGRSEGVRPDPRWPLPVLRTAGTAALTLVHARLSGRRSKSLRPRQVLTAPRPRRVAHGKRTDDRLGQAVLLCSTGAPVAHPAPSG